MSLPFRQTSADGVKVFVQSLYIYDVMDSVVIGSFDPERARESALRESRRLFDRECEILRPMRHLVCFLELVSYEISNDSDGSQMLVCLPLTHEEFSVLNTSIMDAVMELQWKEKATPFFI